MRTKSIAELVSEIAMLDDKRDIKLVSIKSVINGTKDIFISSLLSRFINHFALSFSIPFDENGIDSKAVWKYLISKDKSLKFHNNPYEKNNIVNKIKRNSKYFKLFKNSNYDKNNLDRLSDNVINVGFTRSFSNIVKLDTGTYLYYKYNKSIKLSSNETPVDGEFILYFIGKHMSRCFNDFYKSLHRRGSIDDPYGRSSINIKQIDKTGDKYSPKKYFDSLSYDDNTIDTIKQFLNKFDSNYQKYKESNIIYKTGILLYGKPGTGKTSIAKAIASEYDLGIINIKASSFIKLTTDNREDFINNTIERYRDGIWRKFYTNYGNRPVIVLFDDFDTLFNERDDNNVLIVKELLSLLDSIESPENVIFIATTNYIDKIDPAILRAGRFDLKLEIKGLNREGAFKFGKKYNLDDDTINKVLDDYDTDEYIQAELQNKFMNAFVDNINEKG